jgi:hypothetical protein
VATAQPDSPAARGARPSPRRALALLAAIAFAGLFGMEQASVLTLGAVRLDEDLRGVRAEGSDFTAYWSGAVSQANGQPLYGWLAEPRPLQARDYVYPPLLALLLAPATHLLDYSVARWSWLAVSLACLAASVPLLARVAALHTRGPAAPLAFAGVVLLPATTYALAIGQLSPQLLLLLTAALALLQRGRPAGAGALIALGAAVKVFPVLLGGYLGLRRAWTALAGAIVAGAVLLAVSVLAAGWEAHVTYLTAVVPRQSYLFAAPFNVSLTGFFARLLTENAFTTPLVSAEGLARGLAAIGTALLLGITALGIWRAPPGAAGTALAYGLATVAALLVSPVNGVYNHVIVALPLAIAIGYTQAGWPRGRTWLLASTVLLGLPVEPCSLAPVQPTCVQAASLAALPWRAGWGNLLVSGPLVGMLLLWLLLLRACLAASPLATPGAIASGPERAL